MAAGQAMTGCELRIALHPSVSAPALKLLAAAPESHAIPVGSAITALRAATRSRHEAIERSMELRRMLQREHYVRVLQVFDAFLRPWEKAVAAALPAPRREWLQRRSRRTFLQQDLHALSVPSLDLGLPMPRLDTPAAAWGSLYVIEGSALGGQVITRALAHAGLHAGAGASYFHGWGDATARMWQEFRGLLETELARPACEAAACEAACQTFDALSAFLHTVLHERIALA